MKIQLANAEDQIVKCSDVLRTLRPHLTENELVLMVKEMWQDGFKLAFIEEDDKAVAAIGYRHLQFLYNGKHIYIDDLVTLPGYRGKGYAAGIQQLPLIRAITVTMHTVYILIRNLRSQHIIL